MSAENPEAQVSTTDRARRLVRRYAMAGVAPGLIPIPVVDAGLVFAVQLKLIHSLSDLYGVPFRPERARSLLSSVVGGGVAAMTGVTAARAIPGAGLVVGMVTVGAMGGASTWAVGQLFTQHFESGGTLLTFDPEKVRDHYRHLLARAPTANDSPTTPTEAPRKP